MSLTHQTLARTLRAHQMKHKSLPGPTGLPSWLPTQPRAASSAAGLSASLCPPASARRPGPTPTLTVPRLQALSSPASVSAGSASSGHCPPPESHARGHTQSRDGAPRVSQEPDGRELGRARPCHPDSHGQSSCNLRPLSRQVPGGGHPAQLMGPPLRCSWSLD